MAATHGRSARSHSRLLGSCGKRVAARLGVAIKRRRLGRSGLELTELGFGGAPLGGLYEAVDSVTAEAALVAAWDAGIRYFDTAPLYGFGLSEQRMGAFLRTKPRDAFVLSTKVGRTLRPKRDDFDRSGSLASYVGGLPYEAVFDFSARAVLGSLEASLGRLGLERIDIVYVHDPENHLEQAIGEAFPALRALRSEGTVRAIGAGMNKSAPLEEFVRRCDVDVVTLAGRYTVLDRTGADGLLPLCRERGVAIVAGGVFNSGVLSEASPRLGATFDYEPARSVILARVRRMARICERYGVELPAAALQFPLAEPAVACALVGMRAAAEVHANVARLTHELPPGLWDELEDEALYAHAHHR